MGRPLLRGLCVNTARPANCQNLCFHRGAHADDDDDDDDCRGWCVPRQVAVSVGSEVLGGGGSVLSTLVLRRRFTASCSRGHGRKAESRECGGGQGGTSIFPQSYSAIKVTRQPHTLQPPPHCQRSLHSDVTHAQSH